MQRSFSWLKIIGILALVAAAMLPFAVSAGHERVVALNTLALGALTCAVALPLAILTALICLRKGLIPNLLWATVICLALTPTFMHVSAWDSAFGKLGWLMNLSGTQYDALRWFSAVWIHASAAIPQTALVIWFALYRSGRSYEEQALLDADPGSVFRRITLPSLRPALAFCALWIFVGCSREIAVTDIYRIGTFAEQIYLGYALGDFAGPNGGPVLLPINEFSFSVLASVGCFAAALAWTLFGYLSHIKQSEEESHRKALQASWKQTAGGCALIVLLLIAPLSNLIIRGCKNAEMINGEPVVTYSMQNLMRVVSIVPKQFHEEFTWSATIAALSALLSMVLAIAAVWLSKESRRFSWVLIVVFSICIALPGPLIGSIVLNAREWIDAQWYLWFFDRTISAPLVANIIFCWPLACVMAWIIVENVSADVLESAKLEGASSLARLTRIVISANVGTLLGFVCLLFACCFGELSASQLTIPPGIDTIPRRMLGMLHSGVNDVTAGLTLFLSVIILAICSIGYLLTSWNRRK